MARSRGEISEYLRTTTLIDADFHLTHPHDPDVKGDWMPYLDDPYGDMVRRESVHGAITPKDTFVRNARQGEDRSADGDGKLGGSHGERDAIRGPDDVRALCDELYVDHPVLNVLFPLGAVSHTDLALAMMRGFNDYLLDRFLDRDDSLYGLATLAPQRPDVVAEEVDRMASEDRIRGLLLYPMANPTALGDPRYDVVYRAAEEHGLPVVYHASSTGAFQRTVPFLYEGLQSAVSLHVLSHAWALMATMTSLVVQGVPEKFPDLEFVFLEGGIGWIPYLTFRINRDYGIRRTVEPRLSKDPEDYVREQFYFGTQPLDEPKDPAHLEALVDIVGADSLLFSTDSPHVDYDQPQAALRYFDRSDWDAVTHGNAGGVFGIDV